MYKLPSDIDLYEKLNNPDLFVGDANSVFLTDPSFSYLLSFRNYINYDNISIDDLRGFYPFMFLLLKQKCGVIDCCYSMSWFQ